MKKILSIIYSVIFIFSCWSIQAQTYSFTTAGATGTTGPSQAMVNATYTGTPLDGTVTVTGSGTQDWTVPATAMYTITAAGARGGNHNGGVGFCAGGNGRSITITETLTAGDVIRVLVGQVGGESCNQSCQGYAGGGGGGTFIYNVTTNSLILAAGGGGGAAGATGVYSNTCLNGIDAPIYSQTSGTDGGDGPNSWSTAGTAGTAGSGGTNPGSSGGAGGSGYSGNGTRGTYGGNFGTAFLNGGQGGTNNNVCGAFGTTNFEGGFGGGGGVGICSNWEALGGGGGGYSGGGGSNTRWAPGGGGGNFLSATATFVSEALNPTDGLATLVVAGPGIANNDANGDGTPDITDPCDCDDPLNPAATVTGPSGGTLFHELVTITFDPGDTWEMDATTTGALDAMGNPLALPVTLNEINPGVYTLDFYHEFGVGYNGDFSNGTETATITNTCNNICPAIVNNDADGDGTPDIADPCSCTDPLNPDPATVMGPGGGIVFHELVTVTSGAGETWEMDGTTTGALDATGSPLALPAALTEISPGVYTISFYHEFAVGFNGDFSNGTDNLSIANACATPCNDVPTLGEWGLIIFTLLLLNLSMLFVIRKRRRESLELSM